MLKRIREDVQQEADDVNDGPAEKKPSHKDENPTKDHTIYGLSASLYVTADLTRLLFNKALKSTDLIDRGSFTHVLVIDQPDPPDSSKIHGIKYQFAGLLFDGITEFAKASDGAFATMWRFLVDWYKTNQEDDDKCLVICHTEGLSYPLFICMQVLVICFKLSPKQALAATITAYPDFAPTEEMMKTFAAKGAFPDDLFVGEKSQYNKYKYGAESAFVESTFFTLPDTFYAHTDPPLHSSRERINKKPRSVPGSMMDKDNAIAAITDFLTITDNSTLSTNAKYMTCPRVATGYVLLLDKPTPSADVQAKYVKYLGLNLPESVLEETLLEDISSSSNPDLVAARDFLYSSIAPFVRGVVNSKGVLICSTNITVPMFICMQLLLSHFKLGFRQVFALALVARHDFMPTKGMLSKLRELAERVGVKTDGRFDIPVNLFLPIQKDGENGSDRLRVDLRFIRLPSFLKHSLAPLPRFLKNDTRISLYNPLEKSSYTSVSKALARIKAYSKCYSNIEEALEQQRIRAEALARYKKGNAEYIYK